MCMTLVNNLSKTVSKTQYPMKYSIFLPFQMEKQHLRFLVDIFMPLTMLWGAHLVMAWTQILLELEEEAMRGQQEVERESKILWDNYSG